MTDFICGYCEEGCGIDMDEDLTTGEEFYFSSCCHDDIFKFGKKLSVRELRNAFKEQPGGMEHD